MFEKEEMKRQDEMRGKKNSTLNVQGFPMYNLIIVIRWEMGVLVCLFACMCVAVRVNEWKC